MNRTTRFQMLFTRALLVGSLVAFAAGAAGPAFAGVWTATDEEGARWLVAHPDAWTFTTSAFVVSLMMCAAGLAIFSEYFLSGDAQFLGKAGFYAYFTGALLWVINMGFRLGVQPMGARILVDTSALPEYLTAISQWEAGISGIFRASTFLGSSIFGFALLKSRDYSKWLGWFAVAYGIFGIVSDPIPIMVLLVPVLLGISPLPTGRLSVQAEIEQKYIPNR